MAAAADAAGVDRVGCDLERLGKADRQAGLATWISPHRLSDLRRVAAAMQAASPFARLDPLNARTAAQVERALAAGAQVLMLPMFRSAGEVAQFVEHVAGRARVVGLLETREAVAAADTIAAVPGLDEVHIGLNDLTLSLGLANRFLTLASAQVEQVATAVHAARKPLSVGGLGQAADVSLPVPADLVYAQHARLGSSGALLSRVFLRGSTDALAREVARTRLALERWSCAAPEELERAHHELRAAANRSATW